MQPTYNVASPAAGVNTAISTESLKRIVESQLSLPDGFGVHPRVAPLLQKRAAMIETGNIDWGFGELIAVRLRCCWRASRSRRGRPGLPPRNTFTQRHSVLIDRNNATEYVPLANLSPEQGTFYVYDSLLSEYAALGFEYGYSVARPEALVCWEAQFGDFVNGAQSIIDEFISSGEQKWGQRSGVVLLLPHGLEGQGPDHSSGRPERFLQLCAQDNMTVAIPTTPANHFHLLRWQSLSPHHRPLVVATPKSLLRRAAVSGPMEFTTGRFQPVIEDSTPSTPRACRVVLCTGKVYYDLLAHREATELRDTALVRVEQLYPLPFAEIQTTLAEYPGNRRASLDPGGAGKPGRGQIVAMNYYPAHLAGRALSVVSRPASSAPAVGSHSVHDSEQQLVVEQTFAD